MRSRILGKHSPPKKLRVSTPFDPVPEFGRGIIFGGFANVSFNSLAPNSNKVGKREKKSKKRSSGHSLPQKRRLRRVGERRLGLLRGKRRLISELTLTSPVRGDEKSVFVSTEGHKGCNSRVKFLLILDPLLAVPPLQGKTKSERRVTNCSL